MSKKKRVTTIEELADVVQDGFLSVGNQIDELRHLVSVRPTRSELSELLTKSYDFATMKIEHDRMKSIIKERFGVEV